jgi:phosphonate transport system substrate-binding protein
MFHGFSRQVLNVLILAFCLLGCVSTDSAEQKRLIIGVVSYGEGNRALEQYGGLKDYLQRSLQCIVELEPVLNEIQATAKIERKSWDLVFAPPGLAAVAIQQYSYEPLFPRVGGSVDRSVIVVKQESDLKDVSALANRRIALGQEGSATGYYFPLYNLYGLTLADIRFAPTPKAVLDWINTNQVEAGALSIRELEEYRAAFNPTQFRILLHDRHTVPSGSLLVGPTVERNWQNQISTMLKQAPPNILASAGLVTTAAPPDYAYLIQVVQRVRPISQRIKEKPAALY